MKQITQLDKRTGIEYVYEYECYWDKEKKQSRYSKRKLVGHIDSKTGQVVPNRPTKPSPSLPNVRRMFCGVSHLLEQLSLSTYLDEDLRLAFGESFTAILSVAHFLISEDCATISRFARWSRTHTHPLAHELSSQRASELLARVTQNELETFFRARIERAGDEYWFYDTTSISSYSEYIENVRYGKNKDRVPLAQFNLAVITDSVSYLPVSFKEIAGNISDATLIRSLLREQRDLGATKVKLCLDRGFYSKSNIDALINEHMKFLVGCKVSLAYVSAAIKSHGHELRGWRNYHKEVGIFGKCIPLSWEHERRDKIKSNITRNYMNVTLKK
jgi:transposase